MKLWVPRPPIGVISAPAYSAGLVIDAANEAAGLICCAPKTGNIRKIHWRTGAVTTGATISVGIQTVDRTTTPAVPSGTAWGTNTNASVVVDSANDNVFFSTTLTADAAVVRGDVIALHWTNPAASFGNMIIAGLNTTFATASGMPYHLLYTGAWALSQRGANVSVEYDDGTIVPMMGCWPASALTTTTFGSGSTPDTIGERFQLDVTMTVEGFWLLADIDDAYTVKVVTTAYHQANATGILCSRTVENEDRQANGTFYHEHLFTATADLSASTNYRWVIEPGATGLTIYDMSFSAIGLMDAIEGGRNWHLTTAKDPTADGSFTNYNSGTFRRLWGGLIFSPRSSGGVLNPLAPGLIIHA